MDRFVGVGIDEYDALSPLGYACSDVRQVADLLAPVFTGEPLYNPTSAEVRDALADLVGQQPDSLIAMWSGHGEGKGGKQLQLLTREANGRLSAADLITDCVESGARQMLFVIDTCYSGNALSAAEIAADLLAEQAPTDERVWFGIVVSCSPLGTARDGAFGELLHKLLTKGPDDTDAQRRWSRHNKLVYGDDLAAALLEEWPEAAEQRPDFLFRGRHWFLIPNPLWEPDAPEVVVEHLLRAARSGGADDRSWFTGRTGEVDELVSWVRQCLPGVRVVTGSAGSGKSAIVGRVVSLSNPAERARLAEEGGWEWHADPGERSVQAHVHARGLTADQAAELLDAQLTRADSRAVLPAGEQGRRNASELVGALQRAHQDGAPPPVIVVDGLDEARGEAFTIAEDLLVRLARFATVIVSTRPITREAVPSSVMDLLAPAAALDLDGVTQRRSQLVAMREYLENRLAGIAAVMDPTLVAEEFLARAGTDRESFLLARIVADQLVAAPIDTAAPRWQAALNTSIQAAFDTDLEGVTAVGRAVPDAVTAPELASQMLAALTWAYGSGFPEDEWLTVAAALSGQNLSRDHVSWVLDQLGRYVIQDGEAGVAVYRIAHQSHADHLRPPFRATHDRPFDPDAAPPEVVLLGKDITVGVDVIDPGSGPVPAVQVRLTAEPAPGAARVAPVVRTPRVRDLRLETAFTPTQPGTYRVEITSTRPGAITPITATVLVWPPDGAT